MCKLKTKDRKKAIDYLIERIVEDNMLEKVIRALEIDKEVKISDIIFETKEYDKINQLEGNRKILINNVKNIKKSIKENGYKKSKPISIDNNLNVIDGQHRKQACEELNIGVPFVIENEHNNSLILTQSLNTNQKNWSLIDYVRSYASLGKKDYIIFLKILKEEEISASTLVWLLYKSRNGEAQDKIKKGKLICTELHALKISQTLSKVKEIRKVIPEKSIQYKHLLKDKVLVPLITIMEDENYSQKRMINQMSSGYFLLDITNMRNAGDSLLRLYNRNILKKNRIKDYEIKQ